MLSGLRVLAGLGVYGLGHAQLFAPVTCEKAAWLMDVPISDSIFVTY